MTFRVVDDAVDCDTAIGAICVCVEVWTIGCVSCLWLEILLVLVDHDESVVVQLRLKLVIFDCFDQVCGCC